MDDSVRLINLKTGQIDIMEDPPFRDINSIKNDNTLVYLEMSGPGNTELEFRNDRPPFNNKAIRQAVAYAIDRKALVQGVEFGHGEVAGTFVAPTHAVYDPTAKALPYDKAKAEEKLAEGGQPNGFSFTAITSNEEAYMAKATAVQAQLAEVGIKMDLQSVDTGKRIVILASGDFSAIFGRDVVGADPMFAGGHVFLPPRYGYGSSLYWDNPTYTDAFDKQEQTYDLTERKKWYSVMQKIIVDEVPGIHLTRPVKSGATTKKVHDYRLVAQRTLKVDEVWLTK